MKQWIIFLFFSHTLLYAYTVIEKLDITREGEAAYAQGRYDEAIKLFNKAIESGETRGEPYYYIGTIYELRHQYQQSLPYYVEALQHEIEPDFKKAILWKLVIIYRNLEKYEDMMIYIQALEEMGVKHENLEKFKSETQFLMSPEKLKARALILEVNEKVKIWQSENKGEDFWNSQNSEAIELVNKLEEAYSLDSELVDVLWEAGSYYEKMRIWKSAENVYRIIEGKEKSVKVYYKLGVVSKRLENYSASIEYLLKALNYLKEDPGLEFFIHINLAHSYYATKAYDKAVNILAKFSGSIANPFTDSRSFVWVSTNCFAILAQMENQGSYSENKFCSQFIQNKLGENLEIRDKSIFLLLKAKEEYRRGYCKSKPELLKKCADGYTRLLFPREVNDWSSSTVLAQKDMKWNNVLLNESNSWRAPPEWLRTEVTIAAEIFYETHNWKELYLLYLIYKNYIISDQRFTLYLAEAAFYLKVYDLSLENYSKMAQRNGEQEKNYLILLIYNKNWSQLQQEFIEYIKLHPELEEMMVEFMRSQGGYRFIPQEMRDSSYTGYFEIIDVVNEPPEKPADE